MPDVLSQGSDRAAGPLRRRWLAAVVVLVVLVLIGVVAGQHLSGGGRPAGRHRPQPAAAGPARAVRTGSAGLPGGPDGVAGPTLPWGPGARLPAAGPQPAWYWPGTGRRQLIGGLPRNSAGYVFTQAAGGWAIQPSALAPAQCGSCAGSPRPVYFLAAQARSAVRIGAADLVAPAAVPGGLWLTSYRPGADIATAAGIAREVSTSGVAAGAPVRLPAGYLIGQGTDRGLLLMAAGRGADGGGARLWNPAGPRGGRNFDAVLAAAAGQLAWAQPCTPRCRIRVLSLGTGRPTVIVLPAGSSAADARFSPDGRYLAVQVSKGSGSDDGELAMQIEVAATSSGKLTAVPGTWASSDALVGFGWPAGGDRLVAELSFTGTFQLASWRAGVRHPAVAAVASAPERTALVVG
ncbi:MAG: hypothetical protein ACLP7J_20875 [Streptosporangiaceae bacterium]